MEEITEKIRCWAKKHGLNNADAGKQMLKLMEEIGELAEGLAKSNSDEIKDAIGDSFVVLTILAMQLGLSIEDCVSYAYDQIKNRTGKTVNGVFIKSEDLK